MQEPDVRQPHERTEHIPEYRVDTPPTNGEHDRMMRADVIANLSRSYEIVSWTLQNSGRILENRANALREQSRQLAAIADFHEKVGEWQGENRVEHR